MPCRQCRSYAINLALHGRDGSHADLCDVCYWRMRADEAQADAARYRFLAPQFRMDPEMGSNHKWWSCHPRPTLRGPTLDAAIDAAMRASE